MIRRCDERDFALIGPSSTMAGRHITGQNDLLSEILLLVSGTLIFVTYRHFGARLRYIWHGSSLRTGSPPPLALPPNGYPPMGILDLDCCHSQSYNLQSIVVVSSQSCSDTGPRICAYVVSWNTSTAQVKVTESTLGLDMALVCGSFEPCRCLALIRWHSDSVDVA